MFVPAQVRIKPAGHAFDDHDPYDLEGVVGVKVALTAKFWNVGARTCPRSTPASFAVPDSKSDRSAQR